jgi:hypothetical protein
MHELYHRGYVPGPDFLNGRHIGPGNNIGEDAHHFGLGHLRDAEDLYVKGIELDGFSEKRDATKRDEDEE